MTKFPNKFKKGAKKFFLENPALSCTTSYGFLAQCQNLEKVNDTIQRKCPDRQKDRRMNGRMKGWTDRPYFIGPIQLLLGVQKKVQTYILESM